MDQIPPGNPKTWVPAGVPTVAKYKEPGDVVPMFTQAMFKRTDTGALAMAAYYLQAQNWAAAINDYSPVTIVCSAKKCSLINEYFKDLQRRGLHTRQGRISFGAPRALPAPQASGADWVVQLQVTTKFYIEVNSAGKTIKKYNGETTRSNLYLRWTGKIFRVVDDSVTK